MAHQFVFAESRAGGVPLGVEEDPESLVGHRLVHLVVHLARDHLLDERGDLPPQRLQHVQVGRQVLRRQVVDQGQVQPLQTMISFKCWLMVKQAALLGRADCGVNSSMVMLVLSNIGYPFEKKDTHKKYNKFYHDPRFFP